MGRILPLPAVLRHLEGQAQLVEWEVCGTHHSFGQLLLLGRATQCLVTLEQQQQRCRTSSGGCGSSDAAAMQVCCCVAGFPIAQASLRLPPCLHSRAMPPSMAVTSLLTLPVCAAHGLQDLRDIMQLLAAFMEHCPGEGNGVPGNVLLSCASEVVSSVLSSDCI